MSKREPLMTNAFFNDEIAYVEGAIKDRSRKIKEHPEVYPNPKSMLLANFRDNYELMLLRYSRGDDAGSLGVSLPAVVEAWERYRNLPAHEDYNFAVEVSDYVVSLWLVSFALIFKADNPLLLRLLQCIGNEGKDALFERMVALRVPGRLQTTKLLYPKPYQWLYDAINAPQAKQPELLAKFLKDWYKNLKDVYWYECHKGRDGGGFFGYWAVEAAGVVAGFKIEDRTFRDLPYYPKDIASV